MTDLIKKLLSFIYFFRPHLLLPIWTPALLGYHRGGGRTFPYTLLLLLTFLGGFVYGINQIYDRRGDIVNRKNLPLTTSYLSLKEAWAIVLLSLLSILLISVYTFRVEPFVIVVIGILIGVLYSVPPFRFSHLPLTALILNGVGHGILIYVLGYTYRDTSIYRALLLSIPYFFAFSSVYVFTTIPDIEGDVLENKRTIAVTLGRKRAMLVALSLLILALTTSIILKEVPVILTSVVVLPLYFLNFINRDVLDIVTLNKISVITLTGVACYYFPIYIIFTLLAIGLSLTYNLLVIGVRYP